MRGREATPSSEAPRAGAPREALILAAGRGSRLGSHAGGLPKGLLEVGGEPLVVRALRLLRARGVSRVVLVAGFAASAYHELAKEHPELVVVENPLFASAGTMASLDRGLEAVSGDCWLLESDLFFEARALDAVLACPARNVLLASGFTDAGDEVFVSAPEGRLRGLSKQRARLASADGELVGVFRLSASLAAALREEHECFLRSRGHARQRYEEDALAAVCARHPVQVCRVPDLLWGEIDDAGHLARVRDEIAPAVRRKEGES